MTRVLPPPVLPDILIYSSLSAAEPVDLYDPFVELQELGYSSDDEGDFPDLVDSTDDEGDDHFTNLPSSSGYHDEFFVARDCEIPELVDSSDDENDDDFLNLPSSKSKRNFRCA
jgi:hypothetical protein